MRGGGGGRVGEREPKGEMEEGGERSEGWRIERREGGRSEVRGVGGK